MRSPQQHNQLAFPNSLEERIGRQLGSKRASIEQHEKCEDRELYELCQQLTRENRHLKREVVDLRRLVAVREEGQYEFRSQGDETDYRELNYDCYKKKAIHLLTSLRFLQNLYVEKCSIDKRNKVLDGFMGKLRQGNCNHIEELLKLYGECLAGREEENWSVDELEREASEYQNSILRKHIKKLSSLMLQSIASLKNNLNSLKVDIVANSDKVAHQIQYYCQKYMQASHQSHSHPEPPVNSSKKGKKKKAVNDQNGIHKASWEKIANQRSKIKEQGLQQNVKERIHQSLVLVESQQRTTMPLSSSHPFKPATIPPKPQSKSKRQEITIIDQLKGSKFMGSSLTPSNDASKNSYTHFRNSRKNSARHPEALSNKKSQNGSPRKNNSSYYR